MDGRASLERGLRPLHAGTLGSTRVEGLIPRLLPPRRIFEAEQQQRIPLHAQPKEQGSRAGDEQGEQAVRPAPGADIDGDARGRSQLARASSKQECSPRSQACRLRSIIQFAEKPPQSCRSEGTRGWDERECVVGEGIGAAAQGGQIGGF